MAGNASEMVRERVNLSLAYLGLWRAGREVLEHLCHALVEVLGVLVRIVGERTARCTPPDQFLRFCVEEIDYQGAHQE